MRVDNFESLIKDALNQGLKPIEILNSLRSAMAEVGKRFEIGRYFLSELIMAGEMMKDALKILMPLLQVTAPSLKGRIVIGTIEGDLHDIGKDIVLILLTSAGFDVYDLGIDVPPKKFVEKAKEMDADVIGISALLSTTIPRASEVVKMLEERGLRERIKVILGGAAVRKRYEEEFGVDAAVDDAIEGLNLIMSWVEVG
ncbi:MAG: cobalamin-binding protein [Nitrososphaeria archaeon]|nr:cobalamin-binding protein [Nitrososphaeria archaeon]